MDKLGVCPAALSGAGDGINCGKCQGRICWAVAGTFCEDGISGSFARGTHTCLSCNFYKKVVAEEGDDFVLLFPISDREFM